MIEKNATYSMVMPSQVILILTQHHLINKKEQEYLWSLLGAKDITSFKRCIEDITYFNVTATHEREDRTIKFDVAVRTDSCKSIW